MSFQLGEWYKKLLGSDIETPFYDPRSIHPADEREWLVSNGLGSFASGSISGANTRRYHGLLIAALDPPISRHLLFTRVDEFVNGENVSTNLWTPDVVNPRGYEKVQSFSIYPCPTWVMEFESGYLVKQVFMLPAKQHIYLGYSWEPKEGQSDELQLDLHLIANFRDFHGRTQGNADWRFQQNQKPGAVCLKAYEQAQELWVTYSQGEYRQEPSWYNGYFYPRELERGLSDREDNFHAGVLSLKLKKGKPLLLMGSLEQIDFMPELSDALAELVRYQDSLQLQADNPDHPAVKKLVQAADKFIVRRKATGSQSIIAGYHWFNDWGRDAMISLPGLTLGTGRFEAARRILSTFQSYLSEGMLPNNFNDAGQGPSYNSADATLWWAWSLRKYCIATEDADFIKAALPSMESVVEHFVNGTRFNIKMDQNDALLNAGEDGVALTWMDAKTGDYIVTPRRGKPVEISALWYHFVRTVADFKEMLDEDYEYYDELADRIEEGFQSFWCDERKYLCDVINGDGSKDESLRPNQLLAISLHPDLLDEEQKAAVLSVVEAELLTPFGLRSLSPKHPDYKGRYGNGKRSASQYERDITYHQGTVWAWLLGPWVDARMQVHGDGEDNIREINAHIALLLHHHMMAEAGMGSISEIFDGDTPHKAQGCIAQAWSVAELLRVFNEYPELQGRTRILSAVSV